MILLIVLYIFGFLKTLAILFIVVLVIISIVKVSRREDDTIIPPEQTNKVVNVNLTGGIIGLFAGSPQSSLNNRIQAENANGWKVIQVIPAESGNVFLFIFRLLLLLLTLFLFTTANGYYVIMERK